MKLNTGCNCVPESKIDRAIDRALDKIDQGYDLTQQGIKPKGVLDSTVRQSGVIDLNQRRGDDAPLQPRGVL